MQSLWNFYHQKSLLCDPIESECGRGAWNNYAKGCFMHRPFLFLSLFILRERETEHMSREGADREGEGESQAGSALSAQSPAWGSNSWTTRSWPELKSRAGHLTDWATQAPPPHTLLLNRSINLFVYYHVSKSKRLCVLLRRRKAKPYNIKHYSNNTNPGY